MAGNAYVRKRLYNPEVLVDPTGIFGAKGKILKQTIDGQIEAMYEIKWTGTTQVGEELGTAAQSVKDGTTTPFLVVGVSAAVTDIDTSIAHVRAVALIGVSVASTELNAEGTMLASAEPKTTVEVLLMNGTTDVTSTRYYLWLDHAFACNWGSGGQNASAAITLESPANTTLLTITIAHNESNGGSWHFPSGKEVHTHHVSLTPTATFAAGDGVVLTTTWTRTDNLLNAEPDLHVDYFAYTSAGGSVSEGAGLDILHRKTTASTKCLWSEALIANAIVYDIHLIQTMH